MNLPTEIFGDVIVVHTPDELGNEHAGNLESFLLTQDRRKVVLDIDNTEAFDSRGLESILRAERQLLELGGGLKVATTNRSNRTILEITRLDQQLEVFDSVIDAVKSFR